MTARDGVPAPDHIEVRGARVHNLKGVDVDIPLNELVGVAGVSGSGKSSLALGVLYAEGSRRYLESLSTYTRRRMTQASHAAVDDVRYVPAALALHQRPAVPGVRSTFGTMSELLNSLRLLFSRVASHRCPHCGAYAPPSMAVATDQPITCSACGEKFFGPGAEDLAFNSTGACPTCEGTGVVRTVNEASLVPDESISIDDGAVLPWGSLMWDLMKQVCGAMGVRTNVPFCELTPEERDIVFHGPAVKKHILYHPKKGDDFAELDFTYFNAVYTVENALAKVKDEKGLKRVSRFLTEGPCPDCGGTRLSEAARAPRVAGIGLADATAMTLGELVTWVAAVSAGLPDDVRPMAESICESFQHTARRLLDLGLSYLSLDRAAATLSTGERQRVQLARAVRNRTTGVLYVLDEPSIGLHPANVDGLLGVMRDLLADGNSVVMVDHDARILVEADHLIELGPGAGADGGRVICQGSVAEVAADPASRVGGFLTGEKDVLSRPRAGAEEMFDLGTISMETEALHTVRPLHVEVPRGRLVVVTGVSGSGKTTLVLETLVPALAAAAAGEALPAHVRWVDAEGVRRANLIDATPIGINVRSTVATYAGVHDELRRAYARTDEARAAGYKAGDFSYNTGRLRCPTCDGTGEISLDVQFLPDVDIPCPDCRGSRYAPAADAVHRPRKGEPADTGLTLPQLMALSVDEALDACSDLRRVAARLQVLHDLGLGYLTLGEATPALSGGEAQRLKLASEMGRAQDDAVFVFDEPTIGLHPLDVQTLLAVFQRLVEAGATVIVIEHDLDVIRNADYVIDMGPGGGEEGGRIVCAGTPEEVAACPDSITGRYL
ncbi:excinuclease ABC subunit UvrA [Olsenella sp. DSM 107455]|uniref:UvrABC system protein A n=1 Tax=Thermophilibacter gallinarum TaxID=2779357 RepID=A0ABR9QR22_9ACTN|nr:excinuclease ABC subunit UvrA [Thermophilibacter gallinarum]MBE5023518.1 excinuclease ABC subunit UvrA [Thermophilibacter gallinarum]